MKQFTWNIRSIVLIGVAGSVGLGSYFAYQQNRFIYNRMKNLDNQLQEMHTRLEFMHAKHAAQATAVDAAPISGLQSTGAVWEQLQARVQDTVVQIFAQMMEINWIEPYKIPQMGMATGSGFLIDEIGYIVTNSHVVDQCTSVYIQIPSFGKHQFEVKIIGIMPEKDIALLQVGQDCIQMLKAVHGKVPFLPLGDSDTVKRSMEVMALGYPLGQQSLKSTTGVISGHESGKIQMSAPINPGSSGGPLINMRGQVIGINSSGVTAAQNVGYMIPINELQIYLEDLKKGGLIRKPYLGIFQAPSSEELVKCLGNPIPGGVYIADVLRDSPLFEQIEPGDMLYEINGHKIDMYGEMSVPWSEDKISVGEYVGRLRVGQKVNLVAYRNGTRKNLECSFERRKLSPIRQIFPLYEPIDYEVFGGLVVMELTLNHIPILGMISPGLAKFAEHKYQDQSVLVITKTLPDSLAYRSRSPLTGTILKKLNDIPVGTLQDLRNSLAQSKELVKIENGDHVMIAFDVKKMLAQEPKLSAMHGYQTTPGVKKLQSLQLINVA